LDVNIGKKRGNTEMKRSKKLIIIAVTVAAVLAGTLNGVVFAQTENGDDSQPETKWEVLLDRVLEIYEEKTGVAIDQEALKDSFIQALSEMRTEALQNRLQNLVDEGRITQGEADEYLEWWQAKPDTPFGFGFRGLGRFRCMRALHRWGEINHLP
jgi:hypothetical protein